MGDTRWTPRSNPPGASTSSSWPPRRESMHAEKMQASRLCSGGPACITTSLLKPVVFGQGNDPSAGSPTETLLRLLLPLSDPVWPSSRGTLTVRPRTTTPPRSLTVQKPHYIIRSVVATGGVYKGQGRNQRKLLTRAYWEFLVRGAQFQAPVPTTKGHESQRGFSGCPILSDRERTDKRACPPQGRERVAPFSVARVRPRPSKGITDLLLLRLRAAS